MKKRVFAAVAGVLLAATTVISAGSSATLAGNDWGDTKPHHGPVDPGHDHDSGGASDSFDGNDWG
jgi:hypothetical protein